MRDFTHDDIRNYMDAIISTGDAGKLDEAIFSACWRNQPDVLASLLDDPTFKAALTPETYNKMLSEASEDNKDDRRVFTLLVETPLMSGLLTAKGCEASISLAAAREREVILSTLLAIPAFAAKITFETCEYGLDRSCRFGSGGMLAILLRSAAVVSVLTPKGCDKLLQSALRHNELACGSDLERNPMECATMLRSHPAVQLMLRDYRMTVALRHGVEAF
jgi:hypothetical protein